MTTTELLEYIHDSIATVQKVNDEVYEVALAVPADKIEEVINRLCDFAQCDAGFEK